MLVAQLADLEDVVLEWLVPVELVLEGRAYDVCKVRMRLLVSTAADAQSKHISSLRASPGLFLIRYILQFRYHSARWSRCRTAETPTG